MAKTVYISKYEKRWKVHWNEEDTGPVFILRSSALAHARRMVAALPPGSCYQIKVQKADKTYRTEWTYEKDGFPPERKIRRS